MNYAGIAPRGVFANRPRSLADALVASDAMNALRSALARARIRSTSDGVAVRYVTLVVIFSFPFLGFVARGLHMCLTMQRCKP